MKKVSGKTAEFEILKRFIIGYRKRFSIELNNINHRDKPDFEVSNPNTGECFGIEVTGMYQNEEEPKIQYGSIDKWDHFCGSIEELLSSLNIRLKDKARKSKSYNYCRRMLLAIWLDSLIFTAKFDVDFIRNQIIIPDNNFSEIWLIIQSKDDTPELYPLRV
jgi:hypothetical protein